jgi:hypothetical protein
VRRKIAKFRALARNFIDAETTKRVAARSTNSSSRFRRSEISGSNVADPTDVPGHPDRLAGELSMQPKRRK